MIRLPVISSLALLAIAACSSREPVDRHANGGAATLPEVNAAGPSTTGEPRGKVEPAAAMPAPAALIPAALQGRWGLTPADCTTTKGDAKGLLIVTPNDLHFYESRALPTAAAAVGGNRISGDFVFAGEGQRWSKYEALKINGQVLVRTETNPNASFSYAKCS